MKTNYLSSCCQNTKQWSKLTLYLDIFSSHKSCI